MRNLKKFLALVLALMMAFSLMVTVNAANADPMSDLEDVTEELQEAVTVLNGMGIITGFENGEFRPQDPIRRVDVSALVYRLVTGDWEDSRSNLYSTYQKFSDVTSTYSWAAGYIGYCANQEIIKGVGGNRYAPESNVTGYQILAMVLRAVGYDQNGEFEGTDWQVRVASTATQLGILDNINTTSYAGTLGDPATRELVAEIIFRAAQLPMVRYELGYYNPYIGVASAQGSNILNDSLGIKYYGLTCNTGIILGNQATGEKNTMVGFNSRTGVLADGDPSTDDFIKDDKGSYTYASTAGTNITVPFDWNTGLDMFGHKTTVWYDGRAAKDGYEVSNNAVTNDANKTYAMSDDATLSAYVYAENAIISGDGDAANSKLGAAANGAGFSVELKTSDDKNNNAKAQFSKVYSRIAASYAANATSDESPVNMYYLVSNNSGKTVDVVVTLSAEVGVITEKNTTAAKQYLTLGTGDGNTTSFGDSDKIYLTKLTPGSVQDIGTLVTAWEVQGTTKASPTAADYFYQLDAMETVTKQVSSFVAPSGGSAITLDTSATPVVTKVNFTDGTSMELSGITLGSGTTSKIVSMALPIVINAADGPVGTAGTVDYINNAADGNLVANLKAGMPYTVYVDVLGRFISMTTSPEIEFIYGTFADFEIGALGTGTSRYTITGVSKDGQLMINRDLISTPDGQIVGDVNNTYNQLPITMKDFGNADSSTGNQIKEGENTAYMIDKDGNLTDYTGKKMVDTDSWAISADDVAIGVARVESNSVEYLLSENTQFYVVEGSGSATLKVTPYKGIKALLDGNNSAEISFTTGDDEVVFWTEEDLYGTTNTSSNHNVATVILSDTNLTHWGANTMFYSFNQTDATGLVLPGAPASVAQYELYANGEKGTYFIDTSKSVKADGSAWDADLTDTDYKTESIEQDTFYTLTKVDEINGVPVYRAVGIEVGDNLSYADGLNTGVDYKYIAVNNLNFANLKKGGGDLIFNVANAKICDVEYKDGTLADADVSVTDDRSEITTIAELNHAISVMTTDQAGAVYSTFQVSIVYDYNNVATIYITEIATS